MLAKTVTFVDLLIVPGHMRKLVTHAIMTCLVITIVGKTKKNLTTLYENQSFDRIFYKGTVLLPSSLLLLTEIIWCNISYKDGTIISIFF